MSEAPPDDAPAEQATANERGPRATAVPDDAAVAPLANRSHTPADRTRLVTAPERLDGGAERGAAPSSSGRRPPPAPRSRP